jgi:hypothetical protein
VINDLKKLKLRNWIQIVGDRKAWNNLMQRTKQHVGLQRKKEKEEGGGRGREGGGGEEEDDDEEEEEEEEEENL